MRLVGVLCLLVGCSPAPPLAAHPPADLRRFGTKTRSRRHRLAAFCARRDESLPFATLLVLAPNLTERIAGICAALALKLDLAVPANVTVPKTSTLTGAGPRPTPRARARGPLARLFVRRGARVSHRGEARGAVISAASACSRRKPRKSDQKDDECGADRIGIAFHHARLSARSRQKFLTFFRRKRFARRLHVRAGRALMRAERRVPLGSLRTVRQVDVLLVPPTRGPTVDIGAPCLPLSFRALADGPFCCFPSWGAHGQYRRFSRSI